MRVSGCIRVFLGIFITLALIAAGAYAVANHYLEKYGATPEKPIFPEEQGVAFSPMQTRAPEPAPGEAAPSPAAEAKPSPTPKPAPAGELALVTWPEGLIVRTSADLDGEQVGGIEYKREVYLLETSSDQAWQKIKVANGDLEGWVKGGNLELVQESN
ncbi:MAG: SH3 domain-containing protein [Synechococcales cyanobacterium RM1_1_8]|nr:SH3 domain-containing protein [Synechococcales cyanobacterium RM1_1_8]